MAPTGSGKTHYILNDLCTEDKKCLYICDTNNLKYSVNYSIAQAKKDNIRVMNYHKFGKIISGHADDEFIEDYDYIIADECHNLIKYQGIDNNGYLMASRMKLFKKYEHCKIVFFTANDTEEDMLKGFENGADDYISKPFSIEVLKRKVNAMLRNKQRDESIFEYKDLKIDFDKMAVYKNNLDISLSVTEYRLLELLVKNKGKVITKEIILDK